LNDFLDAQRVSNNKGRLGFEVESSSKIDLKGEKAIIFARNKKWRQHNNKRCFNTTPRNHVTQFTQKTNKQQQLRGKI